MSENKKIEPTLTQAERYKLAYQLLFAKEHPLLQREIKEKNLAHAGSFIEKVLALAESEKTEDSQLLYAFKTKLEEKVTPKINETTPKAPSGDFNPS